MPEIAEVEKLRLMLHEAWIDLKIVRFTAPKSSPNPRKYLQEIETYTEAQLALLRKTQWQIFLDNVKAKPISGVDRKGKALVVLFDGMELFWHMSLMSTGWWMPANETAWEGLLIDPIYKNFLHSVAANNIRLRVHFDNGAVWNYHDSRTWGKWYLRKLPKMTMQATATGKVFERMGTFLHNPYFSEMGPDWLNEADRAQRRVMNHRSGRTTKDVLCDQSVTAGLGNYLACEICWEAGVYPHDPWNKVDDRYRLKIAEAAVKLTQAALQAHDHSHWNVFDRKGLPCKRHPDTLIQYVKDRGDARGSYYCPRCQP